MISHIKSRALLAGCAGVALAIALAAPAQAEQNAAVPAPAAAPTAGTEVYFLRYGREIADGRAVVSLSHDVAVARGRIGDRSLILQDAQAGAVTIEHARGRVWSPVASRTGVDGSFSYDYAARRLAGTGATDTIFNTFLRRLAQQGPALGRDARWSVDTDLASLGMGGAQPARVSINLTRTYLRHAGQPIVLVEFEIPAFLYRAPNGGAVVHWASGFAVSDPEFAQIHALGTQHRASTTAPDGSVRPMSVRTSLHGIGRNGRWRMRFADAPAIRAAVDRVLATSGDRVHPIAAIDAAPGRSYPVDIARRLDLAALAVGEGGANPFPEIVGAQDEATLGPASPETPALPVAAAFSLLPPGFGEYLTQSMQNFSPEAAGVGFAQALSSMPPEMLAEFAAAYGIAIPAPSPPPTDTPPLSLAPAAVFSLIPPGFGEYLTQSMQNFSPEAAGVGFAGFAQVLSGMPPETLAAFNAHYGLNIPAGGPTTTAELDAIVAQMARAAAIEQAGGDLGVRLASMVGPVTDPGAAGPPPWLEAQWREDPSRREAEDTLYRLLLAELQRELDEARREERRRQQREDSGIDSLDEFVRNNAFDYTSMVGIVPTDLSRWGEWLATQNVRELERLARLAGYPNLASALADSRNLIRFADDDGYRRWAMNPPSCGGLVGCGPSYLERWWMRQATVALGDILADSRDIFSTAGLSDIGISGLNLSYLLRDNALQDGDIVDVRITQFGRVLFQGRTNLTNLGERYSQLLRQGVAALEIFAVNEGSASPNTAQIVLDNVVRGNATQSYSLRTGETATLRIETNARGQ